MDALGDLLEKSSSNLLVGWVLLEVDGNEELLSLLINITNIDTTLVSEEDPVTLKRQCQRQAQDMIGTACSSSKPNRPEPQHQPKKMIETQNKRRNDRVKSPKHLHVKMDVRIIYE